MPYLRGLSLILLQVSRSGLLTFGLVLVDRIFKRHFSAGLTLAQPPGTPLTYWAAMWRVVFTPRHHGMSE
jgi:hypothetical protein